MTIANNKVKQSFAGDGSTVLFPFTNISYYLAADLDVLIRSVAGVETVLTQDTDYTVTPSGVTLPYTAGDITMIGAYDLAPPAVGDTVLVYRTVDYLQGIDLSAGGAMPAATLEEGYDRSVMQIQQLYESQQRSLILPISSGSSNLSLPDPVPLYFLRWNAAGTALENEDIEGVGDVAVSAFAKTILDDLTASAALTTLGMSAFAKTIIDDATASAMLTTLGVSTFAKTVIDDADAATALTTLGAVGKALFDANTILAANTDDTPAALTVAESRVVGRVSGGSIDDLTLTQVLDMIGSATEGDVLYRGASAWARLAKGTAGYKLVQNAAATAPEWVQGFELLAGVRAMTGTGAPTDVTYTLGGAWKPSMLIIIGNVNNSTNVSIGVCTAAAGYAYSKVGTTWYNSNARCVGLFEDISKYQTAVWKSFNTDGFTLTWTKGSTPATVDAQLTFICFR